MPDILMACGCRANGTEKDTGRPACAIHHCFETAPAPDLTGRVARCQYYGGRITGSYRGGICSSEQPSSLELAFFAHKPNEERDSYYCGCCGWD